MLVFEPAQLLAFAEASFVRRMSEVLGPLSDTGGPGTTAAPQEIAEQLQRARQHGFIEERDCARWVLCAWCLGQDLDRRIASVAELMHGKDVGPEYKALALEITLRAIFIGLAGQGRTAL